VKCLLLFALVATSLQVAVAASPAAGTSPVARIDVTPAAPVATTCETLKLKVVALDAEGRPIPDAVIRVQSGRTLFLGAKCDGSTTRGRASGAGVDGAPPGDPRRRAPTGQVAVNGEASIIAPANPINTSVTVTALVEGAAPYVQKVPLKVVAGPATRLDVNPVPAKLVVGQSLKPQTATWAASKDPRIDDRVVWTSSVPAVVRVEPDGSLRALKPGKAKVRAASGSLERHFSVEVIRGGLRDFAVTTEKTRIRTGDYIQLTATAKDARGRTVSGLMPRWSFSPGEGIIDPDGRFVPYKPGSYTVIADLGRQTASLVIDVRARGVRRPGRIVGAIAVSDAWTGEVAVHPSQPAAYFSLLEGGGGYSVDVRDPANPKIVDKLTINARTSNDLTVSEDGKVLVISREGAADRRSGISIFTLDDPLHPKHVADLTEGVASGVHSATINTSAQHGRMVYMTNPGKMVVADLNDPANPKIVGQYAHAGLSHDFYVEDGIAYASWIGEGLLMIDVGNGIKGGSPSNPTLISHYKYDLAGNLDAAARELGAPVIGGTHAAFRNGKYLAVDDEIFNDAFTGRDAQAAARASGAKVSLSMPERFWSSIQFLDISDMEKPKLVAWYTPEFGGVHNFWIEDDVLYMGAFNAGVRAFDISGELRGDLREQGREITHVNTVDWKGRRPTAMAFGAIVKDGLIYSTDINNGFFISRIESAFDPETAPGLDPSAASSTDPTAEK
jgi:hypothetical protein